MSQCEAVNALGHAAVIAEEIGLSIPDKIYLKVAPEFFVENVLGDFGDAAVLKTSWSTILAKTVSKLGLASDASRRRWQGTLAHELFHIAEKHSDLPGMTNPHPATLNNFLVYLPPKWISESLARS